MTTKPTPGPYRIDEFDNGRGCFVRDSHAAIIAEFYEGDAVSHDQMLANARAWVDGMSVLGKLPRLRAAYTGITGTGATSQQWAEFYDALHDVIDEAKL